MRASFLIILAALWVLFFSIPGHAACMSGWPNDYVIGKELEETDAQRKELSGHNKHLRSQPKRAYSRISVDTFLI